MFTPFIQYTIDNQDLTKPATTQPQHSESGLDIGEVVGCLEQSPSGTWALIHASDSVVSKTQTTSSADVKEAAAKSLGNQQYQLLGVNVFNPSGDKGRKVAVKGVLIRDVKQVRVNVTSLQMVAATCF